jgi:hypothetical protein
MGSPNLNKFLSSLQEMSTFFTTDESFKKTEASPYKPIVNWCATFLQKYPASVKDINWDAQFNSMLVSFNNTINQVSKEYRINVPRDSLKIFPPGKNSFSDKPDENLRLIESSSEENYQIITRWVSGIKTGFVWSGPVGRMVTQFKQLSEFILDEGVQEGLKKLNNIALQVALTSWAKQGRAFIFYPQFGWDDRLDKYLEMCNTWFATMGFLKVKFQLSARQGREHNIKTITQENDKRALFNIDLLKKIANILQKRLGLHVRDVAQKKANKSLKQIEKCASYFLSHCKKS